MTRRYTPGQDYPPKIRTKHHCRNGIPANGVIPDLATRTVHHELSYRKKAWAMRAYDLSGAEVVPGESQQEASLSGQSIYGITGYGTTHLVFHHVTAATSRSDATDPRLWWTQAIGPDVGIATAVLRTGLNRSITPKPSDFNVSEIVVEVQENTFYAFTLKVAGFVRPVAWVVYERGRETLEDGETSVPPLDAEYRAPILDESYRLLLDAGDKLWRKNAAPIFGWTQESDDSSAPSTSSSVLTNILDETFFDGDGLGFDVELTQMQSLRSDGVPVRLAILVSNDGTDPTSTSETLFRLYNSANADIVEITTAQGFHDSVWYVADFMLEDLSDTLRMLFREIGVNGGTSFIHAVYLLQYCHERSFPEDVGTWRNIFPGVRETSALWTFQTAAASVIPDVIGAHNLIVSGGPSFEVDHGDPLRALSVLFESGAYAEALDAHFLNADDNVSGVVRAYVPPWPSTQTILGKWEDASGTGYHLTANASGHLIWTASDGTLTVTATIAEDHSDRWVDIGWSVDLVAAEIRIWSKRPERASASASISTLGSLGTPAKWRIGQLDFGEVADGLYLSYGMAFDAFALDDAEWNIITATDFVAQSGRVSP